MRSYPITSRSRSSVGFQIERNAPLIAVDRPEDVALVHPTGVVTGVLDLDNLGPEVGELLGPVGAGKESREVENANRVEIHVRPLLAMDKIPWETVPDWR